MSEGPAELREEFDTLFIAPFRSHLWLSVRGRSHWVELEGWQDSMAGPLSAITTSGSCEYAYLRNDGYFTAVDDPSSLRSRLLEWHAGLAAGVELFVPATAAEETDLGFMRSVVGMMQELVEHACAIEQRRWQAERQAEPDASPNSTGVKFL